MTDVLKEWEKANEMMREWKAREAHWRCQLATLHNDPSTDDGTIKVPLTDGRILKITKKLNYSVQNDNGQVVTLQAQMPSDKFAELFKPKFDLSTGAYKKLTEEQRNFIASAITIKPGMPEVEILPAPVVVDKVIA